MTKLGDYADFIMGQAPSSKDCNTEGIGTPFVKAGQFGEYEPAIDEWTTNPLKMAQNDDVLICVVGATSGKLNRGVDCAIGRSVAAIRPHLGVRRDYIYYGLHPWIMRLRNGSQGSAIGVITKDMLAEIEMPFPAANEQDIVVQVLKSVERIIAARKQELQKLDELVKARFVEMMNQYPSHNYLREFISPYKAERCGDRDIPVLSITKEDGIVLQSEKFKKRIASADASTYKIVPRGKLVQGIHIDERNFAIQNIVDEGIVSPAYKIWNVDETKAIPEVIAFAMRTDRTMSYISSKFTGSVKRRESISMEDFMATPIDLPELSIQKDFDKFMKQLDKSKIVVQEALDKAQLLFDSLMQKYFG